MFNVAFKRVGVMRFLKVGRLNVSWSVASEFKPFRETAKAKPRVSRKAINEAYWTGFAQGSENQRQFYTQH